MEKLFAQVFERGELVAVEINADNSKVGGPYEVIALSGAPFLFMPSKTHLDRHPFMTDRKFVGRSDLFNIEAVEVLTAAQIDELADAADWQDQNYHARG